MNATKNALESFREVVQDLLVPELKAVKVSIDSMRTDMNYMRSDIGSMRADLKQSHDALREEMRLRHENLERMITYGDQRNEQLIRSLTEKFEIALDVRERLAAIEARMPKQ